MNLRTRYALAILMVLLFGAPSFAQFKLDVVVEGPWLFYVEPKFPTTTGTSPMLVAIAPQVVGHYPLSFGAGDGASIPPGIYCMAFGGTCQPGSATKLDPDGYEPPAPVPVTKPVGWDWKTYGGSSYVLILPMPDSYSNYGLYPRTFQSSYPVMGGPPPPTTPSVPRSLGLVFHYASAQRVGLLTCSGTPSVANCNSGSVTDEDNSGTVEIKITSKEDAAHPDSCDYHVHRAYHEMLKLLDPLMQYNQDKPYIDVPSYNACTKCDPQQDMVPSECTARAMAVSMASDASEPPVQPALESLVALIQRIEVGADSKKRVLLDLDKQSEKLKGKFPRVSELRGLKDTLLSSQTAASKLLIDLKDKKTNWKAGRDLQAVVTLEQGLVESADRWTLLSISGKDCRAPALFVQ